MKYLDSIKTAISQDDSADEGEKLFLYGLVRATRPNIIVETGTHRGVSALYMAQALLENGRGHLYTADPYEFRQQENINLFPDLAKLITYQTRKGKDVDFPGEADLIFLDSYHEKHIVLEEVDALFPRLSENGIVVFHDAEYYGPGEEWRKKFNGVNDAIKERGLKTVWIKTKYGLRIYENSNV